MNFQLATDFLAGFTAVVALVAVILANTLDVASVPMFGLEQNYNNLTENADGKKTNDSPGSAIALMVFCVLYLVVQVFVAKMLPKPVARIVLGGCLVAIGICSILVIAFSAKINKNVNDVIAAENAIGMKPQEFDKTNLAVVSALMYVCGLLGIATACIGGVAMLKSLK